MKPTFRTAQTALENALEDLSILAGEEVGPSDASWQDVAGTAATNLQVVAAYLEAARERGTLSYPLDIRAAIERDQ